MGYTKNLTVGNAGHSAELAKTCAPEINGDGQVIAFGIANDTSLTSGDPVGLTPTTSGWLIDGLTTSLKQRIGIIQDTPSSAGCDVRVCVGGFTYAAFSTTISCTGWGMVVEFTSDTLYCAATTPTTNSIGWVAETDTALSTSNQGLIFMDVAYPIVDVSSV